MSHPIRSLSTLLLDVKASLREDNVPIGSLLEAFHERGFGFFLFLFAFAPALPFPAPGLGTIVSPPLLFLTAQQAAGRHTIWMPERIKRKTIPRRRLENIIDSALPWMYRLEHLLRPRMGMMTQGKVSMLMGFLGFIMAVSVALPFPFTNSVPSLGICLIAVGILMRDGLAVLIGAIAGTGWVIMIVLIVAALGPDGMNIIMNWIAQRVG